MEMVTIEEEFKRNPQLKQEDIDHLRKWVDQEKCAPDSISDLQLFLFLHCCNYNINVTKDLIKTNYEYRSANLDYFTKRNPKLSPKLERSFYSICFGILPERTNANELVMFLRFTDNAAENFHHMNVSKLFFMFLDAYLVHHGSSNGLVLMADCNSLTFGVFRKLSINALRVFIAYVQDAISINVKSMHILNSNLAFNLAFNMVKPFIYGELLSKLYIHKTGSDTIFSHLAPTNVPKEFGGKEETSLEQLHEQTVQLIRSFEPWLEAEESALENFASMRSQKK